MHNLKVENYVLFGLLPRKAASQIALRNSSKEVREESGYIEVLLEKKKEKNPM